MERDQQGSAKDANFVFTYRLPGDYAPGGTETMAAWTAWFDPISENIADAGKACRRVRRARRLRSGHPAGRYSLVSADGRAVDYRATRP